MIDDGGVIELKDVVRNTVSGSSWVRLTHELTGISVECRDTPSQEKNFEIAWGKLEVACLQEVAKSIGERARKDAFAKGLPICYLKDGTPVYEYPDGRIIPIRRV